MNAGIGVGDSITAANSSGVFLFTVLGVSPTVVQDEDLVQSRAVTNGSYLYLGPGVYYTNPTGVQTTILKDFITANAGSLNFTLVGAGPGVTEIYSNGIQTTAWYPNIQGCAFYDDSATHSLVDLRAPGTPYVRDCWFHPATNTHGLSIRVTEADVLESGGNTSWPDRNAAVTPGGARITVTQLNDIYFYGAGSGLYLANERDGTTASPVGGQFTNHVKVDGMHCVTDQEAIQVVHPNDADETFTNVVFNRSHCDVRYDGKGLVFDQGARIIWNRPGFIEPASNLRNNGGTWITPNTAGTLHNFVEVGAGPRALY